MEILDATLREGEQRSNQSYSIDQKVAVAQQLDELGVDIIQIGFPIVGDGTQEACERLDVSARVSGMARALEHDIDAAAEAGVDLIEVSAPTSDIQREQILGISRADLRDQIHESLKYARETGLDVHFGAMDGFRTDPAFLNQLIRDINTEYFGIADTAGVRTPHDVSTFLEQIDADLSSVSVHFHDDLGVATANSLTALQMGVGKIDVTLGGIGERVGNVPLEELVVNSALSGGNHLDHIKMSELIPRVQQMINELEEKIPAQKPIIGKTAYRHESGMHTAAMLDDPETFEPFNPIQFGGSRQLLFGPSSGQGAVRRLLQQLDINPTQDNIDAFLNILHSLDDHVSIEEATALAERELSG